jgi:hypothetical protein
MDDYQRPHRRHRGRCGTYSFQHAVALAQDARATTDEIGASLTAVTAVTGAARVLQSAPKVALALGDKVDAAPERLDR